MMCVESLVGSKDLAAPGICSSRFDDACAIAEAMNYSLSTILLYHHMIALSSTANNFFKDCIYAQILFPKLCKLQQKKKTPRKVCTTFLGEIFNQDTAFAAASRTVRSSFCRMKKEKTKWVAAVIPQEMG
jgi:hypothetical protein